MSLFLARFKRFRYEFPNRDRFQSIQCLTNWSELLPFKPSSEKYYYIGNSELLVFSFEAALDREVMVFNDSIVFVQGYGDDSLEKRLLKNVEGKDFISGTDFNESFAGVILKEDKIYAYTSITGVEHLYVFETSHEVLVTNRLNLIVPWLEPSFNYNKKAFQWMAGRYHIGDDSTYFDGVFRLKPAHTCIITEEKIAIHHTPTSEFIKEISDNEVSDYLNDLIKYFASIFSRVDAKKRLWLSGGKDSRAILGLLDAAGAINNISILTLGELFSPDVMSAKEVVAELSLEKYHTVSRPSITNTSFDFASKIALDLYLDAMGCSLADIKSVSKTNFLIIGGHENGFKIKANDLPLEKYIESRKYWVDARNILVRDCQESMRKEHANLMRDLLADIPPNRYAQVDSVHFRNSTYVGSAVSVSHIGSSEIHPFLDGRMYQLLLSVSDDVLNSQFIHYYLCSKASAPIEAIGFANDRWPDELKKMLEKNNMKIRKEWQEPYIFNPNFPSQKDFGLYNWRIDLATLSSNFVEDYILSNREYFDFLNFETFDQIMKIPREKLKFNDLYARLAFLKIALVHYFGTKALYCSKKEEIANEISALFNTSKNLKTSISSSFTSLNNEKALESKLYDYEVSIAKLAEQIRLQNQSKDFSRQDRAHIRAAAFLANKHYNNEISLTLTKECLELLGFSLLEHEGHHLKLDNKSYSSTLKIQVELELITDGEQRNCVLVALRNNSEGIVPDGFVLSVRGFYYKYLNPIPSEHLCSFELSLSGKPLSNLGKDFELVVMPWYNKKPIFIGKNRITII